LKQDLLKSKDEAGKKEETQQQQRDSKLQEELRHKDDLIEILKIEKEEATQREKQFDAKIKEVEKKIGEKDKALSML
jgi:hypothetical protein